MVVQRVSGATIRQSLRTPSFWLLLETGVVIGIALFLGMFNLGRAADTQDYIEASRHGLMEQLSGFRTLGYPLFLKAVSVLTPGLESVPFIQLALHLGVVFLLYFALLRFGARSWEALAIATGYLTTAVADPTVHCIMSDFLGRTLAVGVMAALLWIAAEPRRSWPLVVFGFLLVAAYQVRPSNLLLVALSPILMLALKGLAASDPSEKPLPKTALVLRVVLVSVLPLVAFCLFRLFVVGEFGMVSFGGSTPWERLPSCSPRNVAGQRSRRTSSPLPGRSFRLGCERASKTPSRARERISRCGGRITASTSGRPLFPPQSTFTGTTVW